MAIIWIIWYHTDHPNIGPYENAIFFFLSGIFFKRREIKEFVVRKVNTLIIPFVFFYLLYYPFRIIVHLWDNRTLEGFRWSCIFDVFSVVPQSDYLFVNVPLWFLLCLFSIQLIYYFVDMLPRWVIILLIAGSLIFKDTLLGFASPLMFNNALYWGGFYALGAITGRKYMNVLGSWSGRLSAIGVATVIFILAWFALEQHWSDFADNIFEHIKVLMFIYVIIAIFSIFNNKKYLDWLRFYGNNTLLVLGMHIMVLIPLIRICYLLTRMHSPWLGLVQSIITAVILVFIIRWMNKHIPRLVAKKDFFPITSKK